METTKLVVLKKGVNTNPVSQEKSIQFTGAGLLIGSIGSKSMTFTNKTTGIEKSYRLATVRVNIPKIGEKNLLLQVHEGNLKGAVGLDKNDAWEFDDQIKDAIAEFESGETYLTTVRPVKKRDGSGWTLLGNMSHLVNGGSDNDLTDEENVLMDAEFGDLEFDEDQEDVDVTAAEKAAAEEVN
tara:strand:- start:3661 stop:4209 length:549 start_codon:yes stop_codon:yes gene_type:complete